MSTRTDLESNIPPDGQRDQKTGALLPRALYINGQWNNSDTTVAVANPATGETIARVCTANRTQVAAAVSHAHAAWREWRSLTGLERGTYLRKFADVLEERSVGIAETITRENGKPLPQSLGEVGMTIDHFRWFAEEARRTYGRTIPPQTRGKRHLTIKTPLGVVGAISPWNFPLVLAARKIAPALAAGCTIILKPATLTPLSALALAECAAAAKLPPGVLQVVVGPASDIAQEFLDNPLCRKITFTGSTEVGRLLIQGAASGIKPLSLELGGHAPLIVFADADLSLAVEGALVAKFRNTGQSCIAANRIYVERPIYQMFLERFVEKTKALKVADGFANGAQIGPLINEEALQKALRHIDDAVARGARLLCGGHRIGVKGWFMEPAVLADVPAEALCMREETFAPVAAVCPFDTEAEVLARANSSVFGLSAYAFTTNLARSFRLMEQLDAGTIGINDPVPTATQAPFGGAKQSGWGRELGIEGIDAFLETKHVSLCID